VPVQDTRGFPKGKEGCLSGRPWKFLNRPLESGIALEKRSNKQENFQKNKEGRLQRPSAHPGPGNLACNVKSKSKNRKTAL
jgi:hypothetical protein